MFNGRTDDLFNELQAEAEKLISDRNSIDADEYEQRLIILIRRIHHTNDMCYFKKEELQWFTDRFGINIIWNGMAMF